MPDDLWVFELSTEFNLPPDELRDAYQFLPVDQISFLLSHGFSLKDAISWDWRDIYMMMYVATAKNLAREELRERENARRNI